MPATNPLTPTALEQHPLHGRTRGRGSQAYEHTRRCCTRQERYVEAHQQFARDASLPLWEEIADHATHLLVVRDRHGRRVLRSVASGLVDLHDQVYQLGFATGVVPLAAVFLDAGDPIRCLGCYEWDPDGGQWVLNASRLVGFDDVG